MRTPLAYRVLLILTLALPLATSPAWSAHPAQRRVRELIEQVETAPKYDAIAAIRELAKFKSRAKKAAAPIARHLGSPDKELREAAEAALHAIGSASLAPLGSVLTDQLEGIGSVGMAATWRLLQELDPKRAPSIFLEAATKARLSLDGVRELSQLGPIGVECLFRSGRRSKNVALAFRGLQDATSGSKWSLEAATPLAAEITNEDARIALIAAATDVVTLDEMERFEGWIAGEPSGLTPAGIWALGRLAVDSPEGVRPDALLAQLDAHDLATRRSAAWALTRVAGTPWQPELAEIMEAKSFVEPQYPDGPKIRLGAPWAETFRLMLSHEIRRPYLVDDATVAALLFGLVGSNAKEDLSGAFSSDGTIVELWKLGSRWHTSMPSLPPMITIEPNEADAGQEALAEKLLPWVNASDSVVADLVFRLVLSIGSKDPKITGELDAAANGENPYRKRIALAGLTRNGMTVGMTEDEHRAALKKFRSPQLVELFVFAADLVAIDAIIAGASDTKVLVYPWSWIDLLELEGPTERMQALLKARLKGGDLSMAALVTAYCPNPISALAPLLQSESATERMLGVACIWQLGDPARASLIQATKTESDREREFVREALSALRKL